MISLKEFMETVNYKITEGSDYGWQCYGPYPYQLSSWNGVHGKGGWGANIVFSTKSQKVYEVEICDYTNDRAYRLINPKFKEKYNKEAATHGEFANQAWDDVSFTDLETDEDWMEKAMAIVAGQDYSTDISVPIDLPDHVLLEAAMNAHRQNITLNAYINNALRELLEEYKRDPESLLARADKWKEENDIA
jgi:hypothetical protein